MKKGVIVEQDKGRNFRNIVRLFWEKFNPACPSAKGENFLKRPETILFLLYVLFTFLMVFFHEVWRDEAQGFLIVRELSLIGLFEQLHREVHFPLWYLLIFPFIKLGSSIFIINILHWLFACGIAYLVLEKFPFRLWTRAALVFSFPLFFEYSVVARNYTIGLFFLTIVFVLWKDLWRRPYLMGVLLALVFLSDPFFVGIASGLCLCIFIQATKQKRLKKKEFLIPVIIVFTAILLDIILLCNFSSGTVSLSHVANSAVGSFNLSARLCRSVEILAVLLGPFPLLLILLFFLILFQLRYSWEGITLFVISTGFVYIAFVLGGFNSVRHAAFLPAGAVGAFLLASLNMPQKPEKETYFAKGIAFLSFVIISYGMFFQIYKSVIAVKYEILYDFSHGKYAADFINKHAPDATIFCADSTYYTPIAAYLKHNRIFSMNMDKYIPYSLCRILPDIDFKRIPETVWKNLPENEDYALYVGMVYHLPPREDRRIHILYSTLQDHPAPWSRPEECYFIFLVTRKGKEHLFREKFPRLALQVFPEKK